MNIPASGNPDSQFQSLIGDFIASGTSRDVFYVKGDKSKVIKVGKHENVPKPHDANIREAQFYKEAKDSSSNITLACLGEVFSISQSGKYLVMEHLEDIDTSISNVEYTHPIEVKDTAKPENYGRDSSGMVKLRDYAELEYKTISNTTKKFTITSDEVEQMDKWKGLFD
ncbi:hypothetical protein CV742_23355 [Vibrio parahaemolyticus]|nr:hypothetical protein [Vibrio parahaemolyticus]